MIFICLYQLLQLFFFTGPFVINDAVHHHIPNLTMPVIVFPEYTFFETPDFLHCFLRADIGACHMKFCAAKAQAVKNVLQQ